MSWLKNLFQRGRTSSSPVNTPITGGTSTVFGTTSAADPLPRPAVGNEQPGWLSFLDNSSAASDLYTLLCTRPSAELEDICANFPISQLRLDWSSIQADFRHNKRFEIVTVLAQILVRYDDVRSSSPDLHLPDSLPATRLADVLMSRLMPFVRMQRDTDIAHGLRLRLYDFAMALMQAGRDRDALDCLVVSYPSTNADHAFWICACRSNVANETRTPQDIAAAISAAQEIIDGQVSVPQRYIEGVKDMLSRLTTLTPVAGPTNRGDDVPMFSGSADESRKEVQFVKKYTEPGRRGHTNTYELYTADTAAAARAFLSQRDVADELYYVVVETPEGNWGRDIDGLYLERLLPWQKDASTAQMDGYAAQKMPRGEDLQNAALGNRDNFVHEVICGVCHDTWLDGLQYQAKTVVQCPNCKIRNCVDSSNFVAHIMGR